MQQQELKLDYACRLLSGIITLDRNRTLADRLGDIDHALEVAEELISRSSGGKKTPMSAHTLRPQGPSRTRQVTVDRDAPPLQELLDARRANASQPPRPPRGPTLH